MSTEVKEGIVMFLGMLILVFVIKFCVTDMNEWLAGRADTDMVNCQAAGISYQDCYNVIHSSNGEKFSK